MINDLDYEGIKFPVSKKDYCRIERQNNICINVFCYENGLTYPVYVSDQMKISLIMCISKILTGLCVIRQRIKAKNFYCKYCLQCLGSEKILQEHGENCLVINGKQSLKLKMAQLSLKIISNNYLFLLKSMLILNVF